MVVLEGGAFGRWLGHECGGLIHNVSALTEETSESSLARGHSEKTAAHKPGNKLSSDTESAGTSILDFHPPELYEINFRYL